MSVYAGIAANNDVRARADIRSYEDALAFLHHEGIQTDLTPLADVRLASNVYVRWTEDYIAIVLYLTEVVRYYPDGTFSVDNDGHNTPTTSRRVNQFTPRWATFWHEQRMLTVNADDLDQYTHIRYGGKRLRCTHDVRLPVSQARM